MKAAGPFGVSWVRTQSPRAESPFLREGPDSFTQTTIVHEDGSWEFIATAGGERRPHTVREALEFGTFQDALEAFCDVLS